MIGNPRNYVYYGTIKRHTRTAYDCFAAAQSPCARTWTPVYRLYAHSVCDTKEPL